MCPKDGPWIEVFPNLSSRTDSLFLNFRSKLSSVTLPDQTQILVKILEEQSEQETNEKSEN